MKLSAIFSVAEWTNENVLDLVFNVYIKLISYSDFTCASDDFQKARKNVILENRIKNLSFEKDHMFDVFKVIPGTNNDNSCKTKTHFAV